MSEHSTFKKQAEHSHAAKHRAMGLASGGTADDREDKAIADREIKKAFSAHDSQLHDGKKTRLKLRDGGTAEGDSAKPRHDRAHRAAGGGTKKGGKGSHVNVIIAPQGGQHPPMGGMAPPGAMPAPPIHPPGPPMPPPMPPPPPGMAGPGGPPGMPPGMAPRPPMMGGAPGGIPPRKDGGRITRKDGGSIDRDNDSTEESREREKAGPHARKAGGAVGSMENKTPKGEGIGEVGAGGGLGRLAKMKAYGKEADEGEGKLARGGRA